MAQQVSKGGKLAEAIAGEFLEFNSMVVAVSNGSATTTERRIGAASQANLEFLSAVVARLPHSANRDRFDFKGETASSMAQLTLRHTLWLPMPTAKPQPPVLQPVFLVGRYTGLGERAPKTPILLLPAIDRTLDDIDRMPRVAWVSTRELKARDRLAATRSVVEATDGDSQVMVNAQTAGAIKLLAYSRRLRWGESLEGKVRTDGITTRRDVISTRSEELDLGLLSNISRHALVTLKVPETLAELVQAFGAEEAVHEVISTRHERRPVTKAKQ